MTQKIKLTGTHVIIIMCGLIGWGVYTLRTEHPEVSFRDIVHGAIVAINTPKWADRTSRQHTSFDCEKTKLPVEKTICENGILAEEDITLAKEYKKAIMSRTNPVEIKRAQKEFLVKRNKCGTNPDCITTMYLDRMQELTGHIFHSDQ